MSDEVNEVMRRPSEFRFENPMRSSTGLTSAAPDPTKGKSILKTKSARGLLGANALSMKFEEKEEEE